MSELDAFVGLAAAMAESVRPVLLKHFADPIAYEVKADLSPVTVADREAEAIMRKMINGAYPDHGIVGEEYGSERAEVEFVWVLDPIDGTKSFVTGKPLFGTLIALAREGMPILGVIDMPALDERWIGAEDRPTLHNGRPVRTRACDSLGQAWLYATSPHMFSAGVEAAAFERLRGASYASVYGADLYAYGLLARGRVDLVCEASLQTYDYCALSPVVLGAGGCISDWQGRPLGIGSDGRVVAAGDGRMHRAAIEALAS